MAMPLDMDDAEFGKETAEQAWKFWDDNQESIRKLITLLCKRWKVGPDARAAMMCEAAWRLPAIIATWKKEKASLRTHVFANLKWYFYKLRTNSSAGRWGILHANPDAAAKRRHSDLSTAKDIAQQNGHSAEEAREEVRYLLERVDPYVRAILHLRHTCGLTIQQVAEAIGENKTVASQHIAKAEQALRNEKPSEECEQLIRELLRKI